MVEQGTENPRVGGSTPSLATLVALLAVALTACGDDCELACQTVTSELRRCMRDRDWSTTWEDLGADSRVRFRQQCEDDWVRESTDLERRELQQALESCQAINDRAGGLTCEEWRALYVQW